MAEAPVAPNSQAEVKAKADAAIKKMVDGGMSEADARKAYQLRSELNKLAPVNRRTATVDPNETSAQRFVRIGKARGAKVIQTCKQLENLGNGDYVYSPEQAEKLCKALETAVAGVRRALFKSRDAISLDLE